VCSSAILPTLTVRSWIRTGKLRTGKTRETSSICTNAVGWNSLNVRIQGRDTDDNRCYNNQRNILFGNGPSCKCFVGTCQHHFFCIAGTGSSSLTLDADELKTRKVRREEQDRIAAEKKRLALAEYDKKQAAAAEARRIEMAKERAAAEAKAAEDRLKLEVACAAISRSRKSNRSGRVRYWGCTRRDDSDDRPLPQAA
jgi:hypothetical protein